MPTRANGFYWVRFGDDGETEWQVAQWATGHAGAFRNGRWHDCWHTVGGIPLFDDDMAEIDETPIVRSSLLTVKPGDIVLVHAGSPDVNPAVLDWFRENLSPTNTVVIMQPGQSIETLNDEQLAAIGLRKIEPLPRTR